MARLFNSWLFFYFQNLHSFIPLILWRHQSRCHLQLHENIESLENYPLSPPLYAPLLLPSHVEVSYHSIHKTKKRQSFYHLQPINLVYINHRFFLFVWHRSQEVPNQQIYFSGYGIHFLIHQKRSNLRRFRPSSHRSLCHLDWFRSLQISAERKCHQAVFQLNQSTVLKFLTLFDT